MIVNPITRTPNEVYDINIQTDIAACGYTQDNTI